MGRRPHEIEKIDKGLITSDEVEVKKKSGKIATAENAEKNRERREKIKEGKKRKRGRPPKKKISAPGGKRKRGRPPKKKIKI